MGKSVAVVYWSMTGNTETMANAVADGVSAAGGEATVVAVADFSADEVGSYDAVAFGCPAMGDEELDPDEFEPVYEACKDVLGDKPVALFGSYDWGVGDWMQTWKADAADAGLNVVASVIANLEPDDEAVEACQAAGKRLAE